MFFLISSMTTQPTPSQQAYHDGSPLAVCRGHHGINSCFAKSGFVFLDANNFGIFVISSRGDNEKLDSLADDPNDGDAGFNDGGVMFIYLSAHPSDIDLTPGPVGSQSRRYDS